MSHIGEWDFNERDLIESLTLREKAGLLVFVSTILPRSLWWTVLYFARVTTSRSLYEAIVTNVLKTGFSSLTIDQIRVFLPVIPIRKLLDSFLTRQLMGGGLVNYNRLFNVPNASARWIQEVEDRTPDDPVVLFLHGGAFFLKALPTQIQWWAHVLRHLEGQRLSCLAVDYTVTPYARYPTQLNEAVACYRELTKTCSRIIVVGDSAGGNLSAALLAELRENYPEVPKPWACILISGWFGLLPATTGSFATNHKIDYIHPSAITECAFLYASPDVIKLDPKANMLAAPDGYWKGLFPERTLAIWGANETLKTHILQFLDAAGIDLRYEEPRGIHDVTVVGPHTSGTRFITQQLRSWISTNNGKL